MARIDYDHFPVEDEVLRALGVLVYSFSHLEGSLHSAVGVMVVGSGEETLRARQAVVSELSFRQLTFMLRSASKELLDAELSERAFEAAKEADALAQLRNSFLHSHWFGFHGEPARRVKTTAKRGVEEKWHEVTAEEVEDLASKMLECAAEIYRVAYAIPDRPSIPPDGAA